MTQPPDPLMRRDVYRSQYDEARSKSCCITIALWIALGVVAMLSIVNKDLILRTQPRFNFSSYWLTPLPRAVVATEDFVLPFKTLYVFSKLRNDVQLNLNTTVAPSSMNTTNPTSSSNTTNSKIMPELANSTLSERMNKDTFEVRKELCASTGNDIQNMFYCSKLHPSGDNVFFVETSCATNQAARKRVTLPLTEKQTCAIYSAANYNPSRNVILLFTCAVPDGYDWTKEWTVLFDLPNFFFGRVVLKDLYENTSLSGLYHGPLSRSKYAVSHQSDILRCVPDVPDGRATLVWNGVGTYFSYFLKEYEGLVNPAVLICRQFVLYMYGGTYMDLDVISFKSFDALGTNYVICQPDELITAGVWQLQPNHHLLLQVMRNAVKRYQPSKFTVIGPQLFTYTVKKLCNFHKTLNPKKSLNLRSCNLRVLPAYTFFPVHYWSFEEFYECRFWSHVKKLTRKSFGVHYWNQAPMMYKPGIKFFLHIGSKQPLVKLAEKHCPPVYRQAGLALS